MAAGGRGVRWPSAGPGLALISWQRELPLPLPILAWQPAQVRRILHAQLGWAPDETTLQRMFVRTGLTALRAPAEPAVFGRFEAGRPNEIWTGGALCRYRHNASKVTTAPSRFTGPRSSVKWLVSLCLT